MVKNEKNEKNEKKAGWHNPGAQFSDKAVKMSMDRERRGYEEEDFIDNPKKLKVLGYCPVEGCGCSITDSDFLEDRKTMLRCIRCENVTLIKHLKNEDPYTRKGKKKRLTYLDKVVPNEKHAVGDDYIPPDPEEVKRVSIKEEWG